MHRYIHSTCIHAIGFFGSFFLFSSQFCTFPRLFLAMAVVMSANERRLLLTKGERDRLLLKLTRLNASVRVQSERVRADKRRDERKKIKDEKKTVELKKAEAKKGKAMKWMKSEAKKGRVRTKAGKRARGRPSMYEGKCCACVYRASGRKGGPMHSELYCKMQKDEAE
jgi:hypothetical protein